MLRFSRRHALHNTCAITYSFVCLCVVVQEERMRRGDDLRLQMALEESRKDSSGGKVAKKKKEVGAGSERFNSSVGLK